MALLLSLVASFLHFFVSSQAVGVAPQHPLQVHLWFRVQLVFKTQLASLLCSCFCIEWIYALVC